MMDNARGAILAGAGMGTLDINRGFSVMMDDFYDRYASSLGLYNGKNVFSYLFSTGFSLKQQCLSLLPECLLKTSDCEEQCL